MDNTIQLVTLFPEGSCIDTDNGAKNSYYNGCDRYAAYPNWCGSYDESDFSSNEMCCACGGGNTGNIPRLPYEICIYS